MSIISVDVFRKTSPFHLCCEYFASVVELLSAMCMCLCRQTAQAVLLIWEAPMNNSTRLVLSFRSSQITDIIRLCSVVELGALACTLH